MILLVVAAMLGGAASLVALWSAGPLLAFAAAPFAGSLAAVCAGLALHWTRPADFAMPRPEIDTDGMVSALRGAARFGGERPADEAAGERRRAG